MGLCAIAGAAAWFRPFRIEVAGDSMRPALEPGDYLVAARRARIHPGSLVVVEHPGRPGYEVVKRVAAIPGHEVGALVLGPDEYWVLGDRSDRSTDSRTFGPVSRRHVRGVVRFRYWPPHRAGWLGAGPSGSTRGRP